MSVDPSPKFSARIVAASLLLLAAAEPASAWRQGLAGTRPGGVDYAHSQALLPGGDVVVSGSVDNGNAGVAFTVGRLDGASGAWIWRREITGSAAPAQGALAVAVDPSGDVVAAGELDLDFTVVKFDGDDGTELWRTGIDGTDTFEVVEEARAVAVDASGDVVAAGFLRNAGTGRDFVAVKFSGADGSEVWRVEIDGGDGEADRANALVLDGSGNAYVAGRLASVADKDDFAVVRLDAATGAELWRYRANGSDDSDDEALALALHPGGDVIAGGWIDNVPTREDFAVVRLAAGSGAEVWRRDIDGGLAGKETLERANAVAVDAAGDVVAVGLLEYVNRYHDFTVIKFDGANGSELWRRELEGEMVAASDIAYAVAFDPSGDVIAAGRIENGPRPSFDFSVIKFDGSSGDELWRQMIDGGNALGPRLEEVRSVHVDAAGDVIASGFLDNKGSYRDLAVMKFDGVHGIVGTLRGTKLKVLDVEGRPDKRRVSGDLFDPAVWSPAGGSAEDPGTAGAEIRLVNPATLEEAVLVLPPGPNWRASGSPPGSGGYVYSDDGSNGPCTRVQVRPRNRLKFSCSGKLGDIPFTLDETEQDALAVTFRFGTSPLQCAVFGGKVRRDGGTSGAGSKGVFQAVRARSALATACP